MLTMNSAYTVLKSALGSLTFFWFLYGRHSSEVSIPVADFPLFPEVGIALTDFTPSVWPMPISVLNSANSEIGIRFVDFPLFL